MQPTSSLTKSDHLTSSKITQSSKFQMPILLNMKTIRSLLTTPHADTQGISKGGSIKGVIKVHDFDIQLESSSNIGIRFFSHKKLYPEIGRKLTENDVDKVVMRVFPCMIPGLMKAEPRYDWSYTDPKEGQKLMSLENDKINFDGICTFPNDEYWTTVDEFNQYTEKNPNAGKTFRDVELRHGYPKKTETKKKEYEKSIC